jgi:hypothetical protein
MFVGTSVSIKSAIFAFAMPSSLSDAVDAAAAFDFDMLYV